MASARCEGSRTILELSAEERHIACVALTIYGSNAMLQQDADMALDIAQQLSKATTCTPSPG